ncbi:MAG: extracellular solute-binding protein [Acidisphaera sp.]|nr:extracellular solute-binding protein [Acidisphaera sp.]
MRRRSVLTSGLTLGAGLALGGIGKLRADTATSGKLAIWLGYGETAPTYQLAMPAFKQLYPNVQVELLTFDLREFEAKLAVAVPTGTGPDLLALHDFLFPRYYESGSLDAVPSDLAAVAGDAKVFDPTFTTLVTRDGKPWGVPWWTGRSALFYNLDQFKEAGLSGPPQTIAQLWEYSEKLARRGADGNLTRAGISLRLTEPSGGIQKFGYFYYQMTGQQIFEPGKQPGMVRVTLKDNLDIATQALLDHVEHLHGPKKVDDWALKHDAQGFANGAAAMFFREAWVIPFVRKNGPDIHMGVAPMPRDKAWGAFNLVEILSVNKDSPLKKAAWDLIRLLQEQKYLDNLLETSGWIPLRKDRDFSGFLAKNPEYRALMEEPAGYKQYVEAPDTAYQEVTARTGEVILAAYRDASLLGNRDAARKVILKAHDTAVPILKDAGIYEA